MNNWAETLEKAGISVSYMNKIYKVLCNTNTTAKFFLKMSKRMGHTIQVIQDTYMHLFPTIQDEMVDLLDIL